ncbi:arylsulfatase A-like enzyme [Pantoea alhagi]|uniref:sulfatase-like hydrolase/transferase n=1 Tax=Mixta sp. BE291 TaxID=3158787 RepID=UPI0028563744|nr:arylsulfatase A-like enzyme [Pantoea alhagi]
MKRTCASLALTAALAAPTFAAPVAPAASPNVLVIMVDDLALPDISYYGYQQVNTPNIDRLAKSGVAFRNGYVAASVSAVSRAALLTGRYPQRFGFTYNIDDNKDKSAGLPTNELTIANYLKDLGYHTNLIGKWHLGSGEEFYPTQRGFDDFYGFLTGETVYVNPKTPGIVTTLTAREHYPLDKRRPGAEIYSGKARKKVDNFDRYLTTDLTDRAVDYVQQQQKQPWYLHLSYNAPHWPLQVPQRYYDLHKNIQDPIRRTYAAMISAVDDNIGRVLDTLDATGQRDNTLIFFISDNGCPNQFGFCECTSALGAGKFTYLEGGVRVPFIMSWGNKVKPQKISDQMVSSLDILPTILKAAAPQKTLPAQLDGQDLLTLLAHPQADRTLFWSQPPLHAVRQGDYKLWRSDDQKKTELYNLSKDADELHNIAAQNNTKLNELSGKLTHWQKKNAQPLWPLHFTLPAYQQCKKETEWVY